MNVGEFGSMMTQKGCVGNGQSFCGSFSGYPFTSSFISGKPGGKTTASLQMQFNKTLPNKMRKEILKAHRGQVKAFYPNQNYYYIGGVAGAAVATKNSQYQQTNLSLSITARTPEEFSNLLDSVLAKIVATAPTYGLFIPDICPICKQPNCDSYAFINGAYVAAHAHCVQEDLAVQQSKVEKNLREGSYGLGFIGAILGALIGSIPALLLFLFSPVYSWLDVLAYLLVPIVGYQGYKLFKGKRTKAAVFFVFLAAILILPVIGYLQFTLPDYILYGEWYSPSMYMLALSNSSTETILAAYGLQAIFVILGLVFSYSFIKRTGQDEVFDKAFSANTLRPINAFVYNQPMQPIEAPQPVAPVAVPEVAQPAVAAAAPQSTAPVAPEPQAPVSPVEDTTASTKE